MTRLIIVRLGRQPGDPLVWASVAGRTIEQVGRAASPEELAARLDDYQGDLRIAAILPGEQAALRSLANPPRQPGKLMSAASLLLEDDLGAPIEDHHIAVLRGEANASIVAIDRAILADWIDAFKAAGLQLHFATIDYCCLEPDNSADKLSGVLFMEPGRVTWRFGASAFAAETALAERVLPSLAAGNEDFPIGVYHPAGAESAVDGDRYVRLGEASDEQLFRLAAAAMEEGGAVNLLQGEFRPPRARLLDTSRWRRPAIMAASLGLLALGGVIADGVRAGRVADRYESEAQRIHGEAFPGVNAGDIRRHARNVLASGGGGATFLPVADAIGRALDQHGDVAIDRIRYDDARGVFVFSIRSASDAEIDAFRRSLASFGARASESGGYRRSGAFWVGEMTVSLT